MLVDGRFCAPAIAVGLGAAVGGATVGALGAMVGVAAATDAAVGVADGVEGVAVALAGVAAAGRVPVQGALGMFAIQAHGGGVDGAAAAAHVGFVTVFVRRVSAPVSEDGLSAEAPTPARSRPSTFALVPTEIDVCARMVPRKVELAPSVAELPTCQNTLHDWAPRTRFTVVLPAVTSVEAAWKMKTALGSFSPSSVTVAEVVERSSAPPR